MGLRALLLFFTVSVLLLVSMISLTSASPHVGVSVGDWFKYKVIRGGNGSETWVGDLEFDDYIRVEVVSLNGTFVGLLETHWPSEFSDQGLYNKTVGFDMAAGSHFDQPTFAGLSVGDTVPLKNSSGDGPNVITISQEAVRMYCGENRTVCVSECNYSTPWLGDQVTADIYEKLSWDKETGALTEYLFQQTLRGYANSTSFAELLLVENSLWGDHPSSSPLSPSGFLAVSWGAVFVVAAGVLVWRKVSRGLKNGKP